MATKFNLRATLIAAICLSVTATASAKAPVQHELIRGDMPPGLAAEYSRMSNPELGFHVQPVQIIAPLGARVEIGSGEGFIRVDSSRASVGMRIGPVYRMKVTNIPRHFGKELYPSIEILNRLNPPEGLKQEFPIQVVITEDDLGQALEGRLVTKVIYLEDPETALPHRHVENKQPYFDVGGGEDPLRAAEQLGRPMAILRIGSRLPMPNDANEQFNFHAPSPALLPDPQTIRHERNWDEFDEGAPLIPGEFIPANGGR